MEQQIKWSGNSFAKGNQTKVSLDFLKESEVKKARNFHRTLAGYRPTPLSSLKGLAELLGVAAIYVKDESYRFGLNAFKALGATYAMARYLSRQLDKPEQITFATATDGNHGRGVAWAAQQLGQKAVVYMPKGSSLVRLNNIRATGAEAWITDLNYDDTVRLAAEKAKENRWVTMQDTAWEGYEEIPAWLMQGYTTLAGEALEQLQEKGVEKPTHLLLQSGVGTFPAALQGYFAALFKEDRPITAIVEPNNADCMLQSALAEDGRPRVVGGELNTIMAGLACGEPNPIAWNILRDYSQFFISCPNYVAAMGMRILGNPVAEDPKVISGESGAVTTGLLWAVLKRTELNQLKYQLKLDATSRVLVINTEGDTDPESYRRIVWEGQYPSC